MTSRASDVMRRLCSRILDDEIIGRVKIAHLMNESESSPFGMVVSTNEDVYAVGSGPPSRFGSGEPIGAWEWKERVTKVEALCGRKIRKFASSTCHMLALTEDGVVYAWGDSESGALGDGSTTASNSTPTVVEGGLAGKVVTHIACGGCFSVARTEDGKVFTWGLNKEGRTGHGSGDGCTTLPRKVGGLDDCTIVKISTNRMTVLCLSDKGKVFAFGFGGVGLIGIGGTEDALTPQMVRFPADVWIEDMMCGADHVLALTNTGVLYAWGDNDHGQVGCQAKDVEDDFAATPVLVHFGRDAFDIQMEGPFGVMHIWAENLTSYAVNTDGAVYIWGRSDDGYNSVQMPTTFTGLQCPTENIQLQSPDTASWSCVGLDMLKSFNDKNTSDLVITVEGMEIYVHKLVLQQRSQYFAKMLENQWKEARDGRVVVDDCPYEIYRAFLRYLYSGNLKEMKQPQYIRLLELAKFVLDERLCDLCIQRLKKSLRFENVAYIFSKVLDLELTDLADYCVRFAMRALKEVLDSDSFQKLGSDHVREFYAMCRTHGPFVVDP